MKDTDAINLYKNMRETLGKYNDGRWAIQMFLHILKWI